MDTHYAVPTFWERNRILIKGFLVGFLILLMLIPQVFVNNLVNERAQRQEEVKNEVSEKWAGSQTVTGPVLLVPYKSNGKVNYAYILPEDLHITGNIEPRKKKRSLYSVMLYTSSMKMEGKFATLPLDKLQVSRDSIYWNDIKLLLSVKDMHGITDEVTVDWNGASQSMEAGLPENKMMQEGMSMPVAIDPDKPAAFSISLGIKGSEHLYFIPVGKTTDVNITASWKDPKFEGQYLPETSDITKEKFSAHWKILPLSHNYPQYWKDGSYNIDKAAFGVSLIQPVDGYAKTNRSVKYAILFIGLTFTFFFFLEILLKKQVHAIQYILVGIALTIFYTLLLSISEYTGFDIAYLIAALATVSLISSYVWGIFKRVKTAMAFTLSLAGLYGYIYILIQLEDYALLFGSIGLFVILAVIMYYSRKIDWYATTRNRPENPATDYKSWKTPEGE